MATSETLWRTVLLIEDRRDPTDTVGLFLEHRGYAVDVAADGRAGLRLATAEHYDLIALDLELPDIDGVELCRRLRAIASKRTPILVTTARDTLDEKVEGFDAGADDYLTKPYDMREFEARVRALIRRGRREVASGLLRVGDLELDTSTLRAVRGGVELALSTTDARLLALLMRASPHVVARRTIERELWGDAVPESDALRTHIYSLRQVIDKPFHHPLLATFNRLGYRLADLDVERA